MKSLVVRGPFRGPTGYDQTVRGFVRELHRQGIAIEMRDLPDWCASRLAPETQDPLFASLERQRVDAQTVLQFCLPRQVLRYPGKLTVNYTVFEATRVPPVWVAENRKHDLVIVPTESSRRAWLQAGMPPHRLRICPQGVDPAKFGRMPRHCPCNWRTVLVIARYRTRFLHIAEFTTRKNPMGLLRAGWRQPRRRTTRF